MSSSVPESEIRLSQVGRGGYLNKIRKKEGENRYRVSNKVSTTGTQEPLSA